MRMEKTSLYFSFVIKNNKSMISSEIGGSSNSYATRDEALDLCKNSSARCAVLLQKFDNWEFKKDYPW